MQRTFTTEPTWQVETELPVPARLSGAVFYNDEIFVFGGSIGNSATSILSIYNTKTKAWKTGASLPNPESGMAACVFQNKIYVFGGYVSSKMDLVRVYDIAANQWSTRNSMPRGCLCSKANVVGDKIYIMGGTLTSTLEYDPQTDIWIIKSDFPTGKNAAECVKVGSEIYLLGGVSDVIQDTVDIYNPETDTWSHSKPMPKCNSYMQAVAVNKRIFVMGGYNSKTENKYFDSLDIFDIENDVWLAGPSLPESRSEGTAIAIRNKIYLIGGSSQMETNLIKEVEVLELSEQNELTVLLNPAETVQLSVSDSLIDNANLTWSSTNEAVATIDDGGLVTAVDEGTAQIHASNSEGYDEYIPIKVLAGNADDFRLAVDLKIGGKAKLYLNDDPSTVTWTSLDPATATVSASGAVAAVKKGLVIIKGEEGGETYQIYVRVRE